MINTRAQLRLAVALSLLAILGVGLSFVPARSLPAAAAAAAGDHHFITLKASALPSGQLAFEMVSHPEVRRLPRRYKARRGGANQDKLRDQHESHHHEPLVAAGGGGFSDRSGEALGLKRDPCLRKARALRLHLQGPPLYVRGGDRRRSEDRGP